MNRENLIKRFPNVAFIGDFSQIDADVCIDEGVGIYNNVFVAEKCHLGKGVVLGYGTFLYPEVTIKAGSITMPGSSFRTGAIIDPADTGMVILNSYAPGSVYRDKGEVIIRIGLYHFTLKEWEDKEKDDELSREADNKEVYQLLLELLKKWAKFQWPAEEERSK